MLVADLFKREVPGKWENGVSVRDSDGRVGTAYLSSIYYVIVYDDALVGAGGPDIFISPRMWESRGWHPVARTETIPDDEVKVLSGTILASQNGVPHVLLASRWMVEDCVASLSDPAYLSNGAGLFSVDKLHSIPNWTVLRLVTPVGVTVPDPDALLEALS